MNPCLRFAPMIGAHPGELPDEDARALADHLTACSACKARAADADALAGLLSQALLEEANRRDFSTFSDEVLGKIPEYARPRFDSAALRSARTGAGAEPSARPERSRAAAESKGGLLDWIRHHRFATAMGTLAPVLAALALVVYVDRDRGGPGSDDVLVQVTAEGGGATVLDTSDGPVVLFGDDEPVGT